MSFAENLKAIRKENRVTQEELAEILGVSRQAISKWESGNGYPETEKLLVISKKLNVSLDYLMGNEVLEKKDNKVLISQSLGKITIKTFDNERVVVCQGVRTSKIALPKKGEPKYILVGIDKVTFWGEHTVTLGYYDSIDNIEKEINNITQAMGNADSIYKLQYNAQIEYVGFFGQPKIKQNS